MPLRRPRRRAAPHTPPRPWRRRLLWLAGLLLLALGLDALYLAAIWPDWAQLANGSIPKSSFITRYEERRQAERKLPPLRWQPVPYSRISPWMRRAAIVAEDSRFYSHGGIDLEAMREAFDYNLEQGRIAYGASTISQQTTKNLFLSPSRNPLRKWHELVLTWGMERNLKKRRILEIYLNVAEFGQGIYGVEAAANYYWDSAATELTLEQAIELAATLPGPKLDNPHSRSRAFMARKEKIARNLQAVVPRNTPTAAITRF